MNARETPVADGLLQGIAQLARLGGKPLSAVALQAQCTRERDGRINLESLRGALAAAGLDLAQIDGKLERLGHDDLPAMLALEGNA